MINIMLDIETMGTGLNPAIIQLSAVAYTEQFLHAGEFDYHVSLMSSIMHGLTVTSSTAEFWINQTERAKYLIIEGQENAQALEYVLREFASYIEDIRHATEDGNILLWGNGSTSDNVWLMHAFKAVGMDLDEYVKYSEHACFRQEMRKCYKKFGINPRHELNFKGIEHNALDDCKHQIRALEAYSILELTPIDNLDATIKDLNNLV